MMTAMTLSVLNAEQWLTWLLTQVYIAGATLISSDWSID
jgi:hypothetical protein